MKQRIVTYLQATKSWDRKRAIQYREACNAVQMFFKLSCHPSRCGYMIVKIASKSPWVCVCLSTKNWRSAYGEQTNWDVFDMEQIVRLLVRAL